MKLCTFQRLRRLVYGHRLCSLNQLFEFSPEFGSQPFSISHLALIQKFHRHRYHALDEYPSGSPLLCRQLHKKVFWFTSHGQRSFLLQNYPCQPRPYHMFEGQPSSWLFVSDAAAGAYGSHVNVELDLEKQLAQDSLVSHKKNFNARGIEFNIYDLISLYESYKTLERKQNDNENRIKDILKLLKEEKDKHAINKLVMDMRQLRLDNKVLKKSLWDAEEQVMLAALQMPNDLHPDTPIYKTQVERIINSDIDIQTKLTHVEIAKKTGLIKFSNVGPQAYYLKGQLAANERLLMDVSCQHFQQQGFRLMLGPEFVKSRIMEGCGYNIFDTKQILTLQHSSRDIEPMLHLTGISATTFIAYLAKMTLQDAILPLRMFSVGRRYSNKGNSLGLFGASQSSEVGLFSCCSQEQVNKEYNHLLDVVWAFLEPFRFNLRSCQVCAKELHKSERRRTNFQVFAPSLNDFITVGHVSDLGDYVSRRLMVYHSENDLYFRRAKLAHMVSGTAINITALLAVWLEQSYNDANAGDVPMLTNIRKQNV